VDHYRTIPQETAALPAGLALLPEDELEEEVARAYVEHAAGLYRYALVVVRNRECGQDAVQEVFLRYFVNRSHGHRILSQKA
jgi:DNA-directed RNA polymerase specialized sigma24 family protein